MNSVVVPIYKEFTELTHLEQVSLNQLYKVLGKHSIILIGPNNLKWGDYLENADSFSITPVIQKFNDHFFESISGYNRLMISLDFLKAFKDYKFILIYQLDAFVFSDQMSYWSKKSYDYIGAPWNGTYYYMEKPLIGVGNGGFSFRHIKHSITLLNDVRCINILEFYRNLHTTSIILKFPIIIFKLFFLRNKASLFETNFSYYEDIFWSKAAKGYINEFKPQSFIVKSLKWLFVKNSYKVPPSDVGRQFSFETCPKEMYRENNEKLPFGCHAWMKYDPEFWRQFIPFNEVGY